QLEEDKGQFSQFAAAVFSFPETLRDKMQCLYELALILFVLYILGSIVSDVLYKKGVEKSFKKFAYKWTTIVLGLTIAIILAFLLKEFCLLLPLIIALVLSLLWIAMYPKHDTVRTKLSSFKKKTHVTETTIDLPGAFEIKEDDKLDF
ncbi:MAG TPA: hypothetical protein PLD99_02655, partial [Parcubacteria group bacterium]|nr:hypothetical protein [Parcubacteria group bacterium]